MTEMEMFIEKLKNASEIVALYTTQKDAARDVLVLSENKNGGVFAINTKYSGPHFLGFQYSLPIKPNMKTGSSLGGTEGYYDYVSAEKMLDIALHQGKSMPSWFSAEDRASVCWLTAEERAKEPSSIWREKIKIPKKI